MLPLALESFWGGSVVSWSERSKVKTGQMRCWRACKGVGRLSWLHWRTGGGIGKRAMPIMAVFGA